MPSANDLKEVTNSASDGRKTSYVPPSAPAEGNPFRPSRSEGEPVSWEGPAVRETTPAYTWTGMYVAASGGASIASGRWQTQSVISLNAPDALQDSLKDLADTNAQLALMVGYMWQAYAYLLYGVELEFNYDWIVMDPGIPGTGAIGSAAVRSNDSVNVKMREGGAALARLGYLVDPSTLLFVAAGPALKHITSTVNCTAAGVCGTNGITPYSQTNSTTRLGWTAGVGVERQLWGGLRGRLEYRYSDYGSFTSNFGAPSALYVGTKIDAHESSVMAGLVFAFAGR